MDSEAKNYMVGSTMSKIHGLLVRAFLHMAKVLEKGTRLIVANYMTSSTDGRICDLERALN